MSSRSLKITLRVAAAILLIFATVRFAIEGFHSFHTKDYPLPDGGINIEHGFAINHVTIMMALGGVLLFAFSFLNLRRRV